MRTPDRRRIAGLDAIRFVAASWVVLGHFGPSHLLRAAHFDSAPLEALRMAAGVVVNGPAAVIVFFVISGFCIHYPYAAGDRFEAAPFLARRFVRIGLPLAVALLLAPLAGMSFRLLDRMAIWSLFCELLYYAAYPLLRIAIRRCGVRPLIGVSFILALAVVLGRIEEASWSAANPTWGDYPSFGTLGNTVLGYPCWLMGASLAERAVRADFFAHAPSPVWRWRIGIWACSCLLLVLRFHTPVGYPWTLDLFAILVTMWLAAEIHRYASRRPWQWLEAAGAWSYSLYLVHPLAEPAFKASTAPGPLGLMAWFACIAGLYAGSYAFFRLVEKPSHTLARRCSRLLQKRSAPASARPL